MTMLREFVAVLLASFLSAPGWAKLFALVVVPVVGGVAVGVARLLGTLPLALPAIIDSSARWRDAGARVHGGVASSAAAEELARRAAPLPDASWPTTWASASLERRRHRGSGGAPTRPETGE